MNDDRGNPIHIGDTVIVTAWDHTRGATLSLHGDRATVLGFGRTRVRIAPYNNTDTFAVGNEYLRIVATVDGRDLN